MTIFEYLVAYVAILAGLSAARLLHALPYVFKRDRFYWIHGVIFATAVLVGISNWWGFWSMKSVEQWDFLKFTCIILFFGIVFLLCDMVAPHYAEKIESWKEHFLKIRFQFYLTNVILAQIFALVQYYVLNSGFGEVVLFVYLCWTLTSLVGTIFSNYRIQSAVAIFGFSIATLISITTLAIESPWTKY